MTLHRDRVSVQYVRIPLFTDGPVRRAFAIYLPAAAPKGTLELRRSLAESV